MKMRNSAMAGNMEDITKTGVKGLQGLKGLNTNQEEPSEPVKMKRPKVTGAFSNPFSLSGIEGYGKTSETIDFGEGKDAYGNRRADPNFITPYELENLEDTRAQRQSDFEKIFNGTIKGVTTAGTTFLNGVAGLVIGLGTGVYNMFDNDENTSFTSGIWNNVFNNLMNKANEKMEEIFPNYYTNDEREHPLNHIFNANFIGDKFIKNFGFTVGALGSAVALGGVYGSLGHIVGKVAMGLGAAGRAAVGVSKAVTMGSGAVAAAVAEGSIEALQTAKQMGEENERLYAQQRDQNIEDIKANHNLTDYEKELLIQDENRKYGEAIVKLTEDRTKAGNLDFLLNIPILTASNIIQFNKLLSNGYRSGKRIVNVTGKIGDLKAGNLLDRSRFGRGVKAFAKSGLTEGNEEVQQQIASDVANNLYSLKLSDYYKSTIDPQANAEATNYIKATGQQILNTLGREDTWEQFIIGGLTGVLGMPVFGKTSTTKKADIGKGKSIGISGGFFGQLNEINESYERDKKVADYINERMKDPEFKSQYQGLVKHLYFQDKMDKALELGLEKEYKDSEFAQLYNDVMMFMSAGKKDVLVDMIKDATSDLSDEQIANIIKDTSKKVQNKEGNEVTVGPFIGTDGNPMTADKVREKIKKNGDEVLKAVNDIETAFDSLDYNTNGQLTNEQLQQLTFMSMQAENWLERTKEVGVDVKTFFDGIKNSLQGRLETNKARLEANPNDTLATENIKALEENIKSVDATVQAIQQHTTLEKLGLIKHKDARAAYNRAIDTINSKYVRGLIGEDEIDNITGKLKDLIKMSYSMELFQNKRDQYIKNPDLLTADNAEVLKQMEEADIEERVNGVVEQLGQANSLDEFESIAKDFNNQEIVDRAIDAMVKSDSQLAKQYKDNNAVAERQSKFVNELAEKEQEIPTLEGGKTNVTAQDAEDINKIIEFRRRTVGLKDEKFNPTAMISPYLDDMDAIDPETEADYWWNLLGIDRETEEGEARAKHLRDVFAYVIRTGNQKVSEGGLISSVLIEAPKEEEKPETTGADEVVTVPAEEPSASTIKATQAPVDESKGSGILTDKDREIEKRLEDTKLKKRGSEREIPSEKDAEGKRKYWKNNMPQYGVKEMKEGRIEFPKTSGGTPYLLHGVLTKLGAYKYANEGNIHQGDKVKFIINPAWAEHIMTLTSDENLKEMLPKTVFIVKESDNQVIGVLPPSNTGIARNYSGLLEFVSWAEDRYDDEIRKGNTIPEEGLDLGVSTIVKDIMNGFTYYDGQETNLKTFNKPFKFTWEEISIGAKKHKVLHLSIPNNSSRPMVQIGKFDENFINTKKDTAFYKHFKSSITALVADIIKKHNGNYYAITDDEAKELKFAIMEFVYTWSGETNEIHINSNDNGIVISGANFQDIFINLFHTRRVPGGISVDGTQTAEKLEVLDDVKPEDAANQLIQQIAKLGLPIQVDFMKIGDSKYMQERIDAEALSVGTSDIETKDVWFTINPLRKEGDTFVSTAEVKNPTKEERLVGEQAAAAASAAEAPKETHIPEPQTEGTKKREIKRGGKKKFRLASEKEYKVFQKDVEMKWLDRALPQLSAEDRVRFTRGLIRVADMGKKAWGKFDKGIITLSDIAAEGTTYHEAFHAVFNMLLDHNQRQALYKDARRLWPSIADEITLEEKMAEEFRRYVMHKMDNTQPKTLRARITSFFRNLWEKIKNWNSPVMYSYFAKINEGYYAGKELQNTDIERYREYNPDNAEELESFNQLSRIWEKGNVGRLLKYEVNGEPHYVPIKKRDAGGVEFRFGSLEEAEAFENYFRNKYGATFSKIWKNNDFGYYRSYMHKPTLMSEEDIKEIRRLSEPPISSFDSLADYQKSELKARGYTKEDFDELTDIEQEALKECFFTM